MKLDEVKRDGISIFWWIKNSYWSGKTEIHKIVMYNRRVKLREVAKNVNISYNCILYQHLDMTKFSVLDGCHICWQKASSNDHFSANIILRCFIIVVDKMCIIYSRDQRAVKVVVKTMWTNFKNQDDFICWKSDCYASWYFRGVIFIDASRTRKSHLAKKVLYHQDRIRISNCNRKTAPIAIQIDWTFTRLEFVQFLFPNLKKCLAGKKFPSKLQMDISQVESSHLLRSIRLNM